MTGSSSRPPAAATAPAPLHAADDRLLVADLLGPAAAGQVEHLPVATLLDAGADDLAHLGLPPATRRRVLAAAELARRYQPAAELPPSLGQPRHVLAHLAQLRAKPVELLGVLLLDTRHCPIGDFQLVAGGHLMHVSVTPREVFTQAVAQRAAAIVLAHNHPSGDPSPSLQDRQFTGSMVRAGTLLGVGVIDHLIVTRRGYFSFREGGLL